MEEKYGISRDELIKELSSMDIDTRPLFPPVHKQPIYNTGQTLPVSERLSCCGLSLPSSVNLSEDEIGKICAAIKSIERLMTQKRQTLNV